MAQNCPYWLDGACVPRREIPDKQPCSWSRLDFENCAVYRAFQPPVLPEHPFREAHIFVERKVTPGPERSPEEAEHLGSEILQALQRGCFLQPVRPKVSVYEWFWRSDDDIKSRAIVTLLAKGVKEPPESWRTQTGSAYGSRLFIVYLS
jgi:hypothetical protein